MAAHRVSQLLRCVCCLLVTWLQSAEAGAHSGSVYVNQMLSLEPTDVVLSTSLGLVFGDQTKGTYTFLCREAYGLVAVEENHRVARARSGRLFVASSDGLRSSDDRGCSWSDVASLPQGLIASHLTIDARERERMLLLTYDEDGGKTAMLRASFDDGASFTTLLSGTAEFYFVVLSAPSDPSVLYVSGMTMTMPPVRFVTRSSDGGKSWQRHELVVERGESDLRLLAVHPTRPNELVLKVVAAEPARGERVLLSHDGGASFSLLDALGTVRGAAYSSDGSQLFIASNEHGLQRTREPGWVLEPTPPTQFISQAQVQANELYVSGAFEGFEAFNDGIGVLRANAASFERWLSFRDVAAQVDCGPAVAKLCQRGWDHWQRDNAAPVTSTEGSDAATPELDAPDAAIEGSSASGWEQARSAADASAASTATSSGCSMRAAGDARRPSWSTGLVWLFWLGLASRRRRRRAQASSSGSAACRAMQAHSPLVLREGVRSCPLRSKRR